MTTCKEQCITKKCIIKEKEIGKQDSCDDSKKDDCNKGVQIDEKQMKEFRRISVCMQKCLSRGDSSGSKCDSGGC